MLPESLAVGEEFRDQRGTGHQAENDYDLSPTHVLSAAMKEAGRPYQATIYPPSGKAHGEGHALVVRGITVWFDDAMKFLASNCR